MAMPRLPCSLPKTKIGSNFFLSLFWETAVLGSTRIRASKELNWLIRKTNLANQIVIFYPSFTV